MADPQTGNIGLAIPLRGSDVGTWDIPVNGDFTAIDGMLGGVATVGLSNAPVTLTSPYTSPAAPSPSPAFATSLKRWLHSKRSALLLAQLQ